MHESAVNEALKSASKAFQAKLMGDVKLSDYTLHWEVYQSPEVKFDDESVKKARKYYSRALELPHHKTADYYSDMKQYVELAVPTFLVHLYRVRIIRWKVGFNWLVMVKIVFIMVHLAVWSWESMIPFMG